MRLHPSVSETAEVRAAIAFGSHPSPPPSKQTRGMVRCSPYPLPEETQINYRLVGLGPHPRRRSVNASAPQIFILESGCSPRIGRLTCFSILLFRSALPPTCRQRVSDRVPSCPYNRKTSKGNDPPLCKRKPHSVNPSTECGRLSVGAGVLCRDNRVEDNSGTRS